MKICHIVFLILVLGVSQMVCEAKSQYSDTLSKIENELFNMDYNSQDDDARAKRIEENIYGISSTKPISLRVNKLSKDLSADVIGQEIKPKKDSFLNDDEIIVENPVENMDFSIVNNLEKKVFEYEFKTLDLGHRLTSLEWRAFKKAYLTDDLSTRINRLNNAIIYNKFPVEDNKTVEIPTSQQKLFTLENKSEQKLIPIPNSIDKQEQVLDPRIKLVALEKSIFVTSYPNEKNPERLARLESKIFNSTFPNDDDLTRLNRIEGANQAKISIKKYNSNRASQHTATAIQMGTIFLMILPFLL